MRIWKLKVPPKIQFFLWKLERIMLPTAELLSRSIGNSISPICKRCNLTTESQNHMLWNCDIAKNIWKGVADWWGLIAAQVNLLGSSLWEAAIVFASNKVRT